MKRKLALFMVLAMLVSLVPMNVFAASANTPINAPSVTKDTIVGQSGVSTPSIRITEGETGQWTADSTTRTFELVLTNGEFQTRQSVIGAVTAMKLNGTTTNTNSARFVVTRKSDAVSIVDMWVKTGNSSSTTNKYMIDIPLCFKATGGEATIKVDHRDSQVSDGTIVVANAVDGATKTTIASVKSFGDTVFLDTLRIDESTIGSVPALKTQTVKLKLNAGFEWVSTTASVTSSGGWTTAATVNLTADATDGRIVTFPVKPGTTTATSRGTLYMGNLKIKRTSDAKVGDVTMTINSTANSGVNTLTEETINVAKYATYDVTVKAVTDPTTIYAGAYENTNGDDNAHKLAKLKIKEEVQNSWLASRITKIQFNDEVKIMGFKIRKNDGTYVTNGSIKTDNNAALGLNAGLDTYRCTTLTNRNYIEISNATISSGNKADVDIEFYVSVKGNYTGDITATVGGTALTKETKVVLGKAIAPAAIKMVQTKDLKLGLKNQPVGDIVITEPAKGVWGANADGTTKYLQVSFDTLAYDCSINEKGTVKVTKGDLTIGNYTTAGKIPVKYSSTVASEITITGMTVDLSRSMPEGKFDVQIGGTSVVANNATDEKYAKFNKSTCASSLGFNVITPADANTKTIAKVVFTIGAKEYKVGDTAVTADVAPMIDANNRTLLPLRALANALNVSNESIVWNEADRSVTIFKGESIVKVVIGQSQFIKNGVVIPMDTQAVIIDGRTMMPLRAVGQALGFTPVWDEATKTVTIQ